MGINLEERPLSISEIELISLSFILISNASANFASTIYSTDFGKLIQMHSSRFLRISDSLHFRKRRMREHWAPLEISPELHLLLLSIRKIFRAENFLRYDDIPHSFYQMNVIQSKLPLGLVIIDIFFSCFRVFIIFCNS